MNKDLKIFLNFRRLRFIKRCNNFPTVNPEDVAQHSFYTVLLSMSIADEYNTWVDENFDYYDYEAPNTLDSEKVIRKALLHDVEESFTSDIPWNIKHHSKEVHKAIAEAIENKMEKVYEDSKTAQLWKSINLSSKDGAEGALVDLCDMLELALFCFEEKQKGNMYMNGLLKKALVCLKNHKLYEIMLKASPLFNSCIGMLHTENSLADEFLNID